MPGVITPAFVTKMVTLGKSLAGPLLASVQHTAWAGQDAYGDTLPGTTVSRDALVQDYQHTFRRTDGTEVQSQARLTFLEHVAMTLNDTLILPDGRTGQLLDIKGVVDASQGGRYVTVVVMGRDPMQAN